MGKEKAVGLVHPRLALRVRVVTQMRSYSDRDAHPLQRVSFALSVIPVTSVLMLVLRFGAPGHKYTWFWGIVNRAASIYLLYLCMRLYYM